MISTAPILGKGTWITSLMWRVPLISVGLVIWVKLHAWVFAGFGPSQVLPAVNTGWRMSLSHLQESLPPAPERDAASCNINKQCHVTHSVTLTRQASSMRCDVIVFKWPQDHSTCRSVVSQSRALLAQWSHLHFKNKLILTALHLWSPHNSKTHTLLFWRSI